MYYEVVSLQTPINTIFWRLTHPWKARYRYMKKMPNPFPTLLVVPEYWAVIAARQDVVTMIPTKPVMYMLRRELTLS